MTKEQICTLLDHVRFWPQEDQEELAEIAREIEARRTGMYVMNDEERVAVREGLEQARRGDFVSDEEMDAFSKKLGVECTHDQRPVEAMLDRVLTWSAEAQQEAVASLATIEEQFAALQTLSSDDRDALSRSAEDARHGKHVTDDQVKTIFDRYRRA